MGRRQLLGIAAIVGAFFFLYRDVLVWLVDDWDVNGNYSHGYLVAPIALYLIWERRDRLRETAIRPSGWGLAALIVCMLMLMAGTIAAETFSARVSLVGTIVASIWFVAGAGYLRVLWFPLAFLLLMIPIPAIIFNRIAFPLQLIASEFGERTLSLANIPVFREGNLIVLENMTLDVAEACSGIRSLVSLFTLSVLYGYFTTPSVKMRVLLALSTVPIAIVANGLRVAGTGLGAHVWGPTAAEGFFHEASGWAVFVVAALALGAVRSLATAAGRLLGNGSLRPTGDLV
jgi:exosortase